MVLLRFCVFSLLFCGLAVGQDSLQTFQTPNWKSLDTINAWVRPQTLNDQFKVTAEDDCVVLDASALEKSTDFGNIQMNVPGIDAQAVEGKNWFFTLDIEGPKNAALNLFLEGADREGKFMAVRFQQGGGNSLVLRGGRQTAKYLTRLPDGIRDLRWRFDLFQPGVYRIYSMKAEFVPQPDAQREAAEKPQLLFYAPFDGSALPEFAAGNPQPLDAKNVRFSEGIKGQAAEFSPKDQPRLSYELAKNLCQERGTISVWVKRNPESDETWRTILSLPWEHETRIGSGALWFWVWCGRLRFDTSDAMDRSLVSELPPSAADAWVHLAVTWNTLERYVYVNGKCVQGKRGADKRLDPVLPLIYRPLKYDRFDVGCFCGRNWLNGSLDELKIYSAPLSEADVAELYRQDRPLILSVDKRYFYDDAPVAVAGTIENAADKPLAVRIRLQDDAGNDLAAPLSRTVGYGATSFEFPARSFSAGWASVSLEYANQTAAKLPIRFFRSASQKADSQKADSQKADSQKAAAETLSLELVETIDPLSLDDSRLAFVGPRSTGELNGRKYLEASPEYESRFAVRLPKMEPDALYCLDVDIPDDRQRTVDIIAQDSLRPGANQYELQNGYLTGDEYPCTNEFLTQRLLYRPRTADNSLLFMTARTGEAGAAVAQIRVWRVLGPLPAAQVCDAQPVNGWTRSVGVYYEDAALGYDFGGGLDDPEQLETTMTRLCEYMRFSGQNMLTYPVVWYQGRIGKEYPARPHAPDYFDAMLTIFDRERLSFMASVNQYQVLFPTPLVTAENLKDGSLNNSPYMIHSNGEPNKTHSICLFHPEVEAMMNRYVDEILAEGVNHPSFKGISFHMVFNNLTTFGDLKMGYNDYLIKEFEKDTGIAIPVDPSAPDRGKQYADWLLSHARDTWIDWRCQKLARFYRSLAQKLSDARPDLRLTLNCKVAIGYQANFGLPNEFQGQRDYWEQANREMGIDAKYFRDAPNIVVEQTVFPADYRWMAGRSDETVRDTIRLTETQSGQYGTVREAARPWINIHDRYWETAVGNPARNSRPVNQFHADWLKEHPWRVSTLNPTGFYAIRPYIMPLRYCDIQAFNKGGFLIGTLGMEASLREFAQSFRSLPAVVFDDVPGSTETVRVRQYTDGQTTWFYVVNTEEKPVRVVLKPGAAKIVNTGTNTELNVPGGTFNLELLPYRLECFRYTGNAPVVVERVARPASD